MGTQLRYSRRTAVRLTAPTPLALAVSLLLGATLVGPADAGPPVRSAEGPWAKSRVLVMPKPGLSGAQMAKMLHGGKATKIGGSNLHIVELPANASEKAVAALMANNPHFEFAELDYEVKPALLPNDPYFGSAWHLPKIGAPTAWDSSTGIGVTVAILDSGVDAAHPDLSSQLVSGWNFYDNNSNTADVYGHGTAVAGGAAAATNNTTGVSAVAGQARIMPIRVTDTSGSGYTSMIANGIIYAADRGVRVANVSFANQPSRSSVVSAGQYMKGKGGLVFVAAGNSGIDEGFTPTNALIPVSATDGADAKTSWSSYGSYVMLAAPGAGIYSTTRGGGYSAVSGTSIASPVAAGVAALVMAANPKLSSTEVEKILFSTAVDLGAAGKDAYYGNGRVNASAAVQAALSSTSSTPPADTQAPSASISAPLGSSTVSGQVAVGVNATDNVGLTKVELRVNGSTYATDTSSPFAFSWDTTKLANGGAIVEAVAFDAAGNSAKSAAVSVTVSNTSTVAPPPIVTATDTIAPTVTISNPTEGSRVSGNVVITISAADNMGASGITQELFIDGKLIKTSTGGSLTYKWNTRPASTGTHTIAATVKDKAGNTASRSVKVNR